MFRMKRIVIVIALLGVIWFFWPFGKYEDVVSIEPAPPSGGVAEETAQPTPAPSAGEGQASTTGGAHAVLPDGTAPSSKPMEQANPRLQPKRFFRVLVLDSGALQAGDTKIRLAHIEVAGEAGACKDEQGRTWACARHAQSALRRLIRGRAVICEVPVSGGGKNLTAPCKVGGRDLSHWMVAHGWAKTSAKTSATAQTKLDEAQKNARERKLGMWR